MDKYQIVITVTTNDKMYYLAHFTKDIYNYAVDYLNEIAKADYVTLECHNGTNVMLRKYLLDRSIVEIRKVDEKC